MSNRISTIIKAVTDLPARLFGGNAQKVEVSGLDYTLHLDLEKLPPAEAGEAPGKWTVVWDEVSDTYRRVEFTDLPPPLGSLGLSQEEVDDRVAQLIKAGANVAVTYNDAAGTVTISAAPSGVIAGSLGNIFDHKAAAELTALAPGTKSLILNGYAEIGDTGQVMACKRVDAQPTLHTGWLRTADRYTANGIEDAVNGGYWEYTYPAEGIRIEWFGGKADAGTTDNTPAFERCQDFVATAYDGSSPGVGGWYLGGPKILWGPCFGSVFTDSWYHCQTTLVPNRTIAMHGSKSLYPRGNGGFGTLIRFPAGVMGIDLQGYTSTPSATPGAQGSHFEDIFFQCTSKAPGVTDQHGIDARCQFSMRACTFHGFSGNGCNIAADINVRPGNNANLWQIERSYFGNNAKNGLEVAGGDSNAGYGELIDASGNDYWGIDDHSFLANTYVAPHADANGLGPYKGGGGNAPTTFIGGYSEGNQPPSQAHQRCTFIGGLHGAGVDTSFGGSHIEGQGWHGTLNLSPASPPDGGTNKVALHLVPNQNTLLRWETTAGAVTTSLPYDLRYYPDDAFYLEFGNLTNFCFGITPPEGSIQRDPRVGYNRFMLPSGAFLGSDGSSAGGQYRGLTFESQPPNRPNTSYLRGDVAFSLTTDPQAGWKCTDGGISAPAWTSGTTYTVHAYVRAPGNKVYECTAQPGNPDAWTMPATTIEPTHTTGTVNYPEPNPYAAVPGAPATIPGYTWEVVPDNFLYVDWEAGEVWGDNPTVRVRNSAGIAYANVSPFPTAPTPIFSPAWTMPTSTVVPTHTSGIVEYPEPNPSPSGSEPATMPGYLWRYVTTGVAAKWAQFGDLFVDGYDVWDAPSLAAGTSSVVRAFAVPGANTGDFVDISSNWPQAGVEFNAWVSAVDEVSYQIHNRTASAVDRFEAVYYVRVRKHGGPPTTTLLPALPGNDDA